MNTMNRKLKCLRCGYEWKPRKRGRPVECPDCKTRDWDQKKMMFSMIVVLLVPSLLFGQDSDTKKAEAALIEREAKVSTPEDRAALGDEWAKAAPKAGKDRKRFEDHALVCWIEAWPKLDEAGHARLRDRLRAAARVPADYDRRPKAAGKAVGWEEFTDTWGRSIDEAFARSGRRSVKLLPAPKSPNTLSVVVTGTIPCDPGAKYTFSAWVLSDLTDADGSFEVRFTDKAGSGLPGKGVVIPADSPFWQAVRGEVEVPAGAFRMHVLAQAKLTRGAIWIDNCSVMSGGKELLRNGGFEDR